MEQLDTFSWLPTQHGFLLPTTKSYSMGFYTALLWEFQAASNDNLHFDFLNDVNKKSFSVFTGHNYEHVNRQIPKS